MSSARAKLSVLAFVAALVLAACGKKAGSSCKGTESTCLDKKTALACRSGKLVPVSCNGALGCSKFADHANCDDSIASAGDSCMDEEYACTPDKKRALVCKNGKFQLHLECRGKGGCALLGQQVSCDTSVANKGDPCKVQGAVACSDDQKQMVICKDGKFEIHRYCRGQYGCYSKNDAPACDETLSLDGDPCGIAGYVVCSVDGKSELVCQGGRFTTARACKTACTVMNRPGRPIDCQ